MDVAVVGVFVPIIGTICVFTFLTLIIVLPALYRSREKQKLQDTIRLAIEKGQELPPEVINALTAETRKAPSTAHKDLRAGAIWLAVGLGAELFGLVLGYEGDEFPHPIMGLAAVPIFIGAALIIISFFNPNKGENPDKSDRV